MENYLDLQASFKFNISINLPKNQISFKPYEFLIINGFKIKIIQQFAIYCSQKISDMYMKEKMRNNYFDDENVMKITIGQKNQYENLITKENLAILQSFLCMRTIIFTKNNLEFLKFISKELEIFLLSNALSIYENFIDDKFVLNSKPVKIFNDDTNFQNLLEKYSNECNELIISNQIQKVFDIDQHYFYQSIVLSCISNPIQMEKFILIIKEMNKLSEFEMFLKLSIESNPIFRNEKQFLIDLIQSETVIDEENKTKNESFINSVIQLIRNDDIDEFQRIFSSFASFDLNSNINLNQSMKENRITLFSDIHSLLETNSNQINYNFLDFAAFYGSVKIFKYLLLMKVEKNRYLALFAVAGGNNEIIHICEQNKCDFRNAIKIAIIYNHIELIDWLIDTINIDQFESFIDDMILFHRNELILKYINLKRHNNVIQQLIVKSIIYDNYELFLFLNDVENIDLKYKFDENKSSIFSLLSNNNNPKFGEFLFNIADLKFISADRDIYGQSPAHIAAIKGNLKLLKFLVEKKMNIESRAYDDLTPLHLACMFCQYEIVKYIISLPNINVNCLDRYKQTPLAKVCITNNPNTLKIIELLLNNVFVQCNYVDINNKTLLLNTIQNGTEDAALMLINCNKYIDVNKGDMFFNPLSLACKLNKIEIVRCLIKHKDLNVNEQAFNGIFLLLFVYFSALHVAVSSSIQIVNLLLSHQKIDVNICNKDVFFSIEIIKFKFIKTLMKHHFI